MIDCLTRHPTGTVFEADLCVIGGGPVGIAIAREFVEGGIRVLMLESGGETPDEATQSLNCGAVVGGPFTTLEDGRVRALGGTTWKWAGGCLPLDPEALQDRPWIPATGWPFGAEELEAYTERAAGFFGIRDPRFAGDVWSEFGVTPPRFEGSVLIAKHTVFAQPLNSARAHLKTIRQSPAVTTLLHATVVRLALSGSGDHVEQVEIASLDGARAACGRGHSFSAAAQSRTPVFCCLRRKSPHNMRPSGAFFRTIHVDRARVSSRSTAALCRTSSRCFVAVGVASGLGWRCRHSGNATSRCLRHTQMLAGPLLGALLPCGSCAMSHGRCAGWHGASARSSVTSPGWPLPVSVGPGAWAPRQGRVRCG